MRWKGIDVSDFQETIDWKKVKDDNIRFAIIRAGYGQYSNQIDRRFEENYRNAKAAGIPVGAYLYSYAKSTEDANAEAENMLGWIRGKQFEFPIYYDLEDISMESLNRETLSSIAVTFCKTMEQAGYFAGIYANKYWLTEKLITERIRPYTTWLAQYAPFPTYSGPFSIWQYTSSGSVDGIDGRCDLDYCYEDFPSIIKKAGLNGFEKHDNPDPMPPIKETRYTVQRGDTLSEIAQRYGTTYQKLAAYNRLQNPDLIYPGQIILIPREPTDPVRTYTVRKGDTLSGIAQKYNIAYQVLAAYNNIKNPDRIYPGQIIKIPNE